MNTRIALNHALKFALKSRAGYEAERERELGRAVLRANITREELNVTATIWAADESPLVAALRTQTLRYETLALSLQARLEAQEEKAG